MDNSSISTRLKAIIQYLGLSDSQFADRCEISRATLSLLLSGKNKKISDVLLSQIHSTFPEISIIWLLFDEGKMVADDEISSQPATENNLTTENEKFMGETPNLFDYPNLNPLNNLENTIKLSVKKAFDSFLGEEGLDFKKFLRGENKRKVRQVTVYYDDSTFETFVPIG